MRSRKTYQKAEFLHIWKIQDLWKERNLEFAILTLPPFFRCRKCSKWQVNNSHINRIAWARHLCSTCSQDTVIAKCWLPLLGHVTMESDHFRFAENETYEFQKYTLTAKVHEFWFPATLTNIKWSYKDDCFHLSSCMRQYQPLLPPLSRLHCES